jgi:hypothetical protein
MRETAIALFVSSAMPAMAEDFLMSLPIDCTLGANCYIEDYVDNNPAKGPQRDYTCGPHSRDGHKGTDFALTSFNDLDSGVSVLAAADGTVLRTRDSMPDDKEMRGVTSQNACGNAVLLDHGNGWSTLYCHLKQGTVAVAPGQIVRSGTYLGDVGLSGQTNHPHLHMSVTKEGKIVDPFHPSGEECGQTQATLWESAPAYDKTGFLTAGFSSKVPTLSEIRKGDAHLSETRPDAPIIVFGHVAYAQPGDVLTLSATAPNGQEIFVREIVLENPKISQMQAFGRKPPAKGWQKGEYIGKARLTRDDRLIGHRFSYLTVK